MLSELIYVALLRLDALNGARPVLLFLSLMGGLFALYALAYLNIRNNRYHHDRVLVVIGGGALLFRLTLLLAGLPHDASARSLLAGLRADVRGDSVAYDRFQLFDDDVWRYLWDGHVWAHGINPYLYAPGDPSLDSLADGRAVWSDIRDNINYAGIPTIYPPLAQAIFRLSHSLAPGSVLVMKSLFMIFDLLAVVFIALSLQILRRPAEHSLLYAWNPLVIKVFSGSGHADAIVAAMVAATAYLILRGARRAAAFGFGLAVLAKIIPVILLPFVLKRIGKRNCALSGAVILGAYIPFTSAGAEVFKGTLTFARDWQFNAGFFALLRWFVARMRPPGHDSELIARAVCALAILSVVCWLARRDDGRIRTFAPYAAAALGAVIILGPTAMPWYVAWILPLAVISDGPAMRLWIYYSALVCLAFLVMIDETEHSMTLGLEYGAVALLMCLEGWRAKLSHRRLRRPSPGSGPAEAGNESALVVR